MTAVRWKLAFGLAVLLAATPAAADTVVTAEEVIPCSVESADASFLGLKLPQGGFRVMYTRDIYELRLSDSSRVAELATRLPQLRIILDSGQLVAQSEFSVVMTLAPVTGWWKVV